MRDIKVKSALSALLFIISVSCGINNGNNTNQNQGNGQQNIQKNNQNVIIKSEFKQRIPNIVTNSQPAVDGGAIKVAVINKTAFTGTLNEIFATDEADKKIMNLIGTRVLEINDDFEPTDKGIIDEMYIENDDKKLIKKVRFKIKEGIKWSDGQPLTADDFIYTYEVVADKDYKGNEKKGISYIKGVNEYNQGNAEKIPGIKKIDNRTVEIEFKGFPGTITAPYMWGLLRYVLPKHHLNGIPVKDMPNSPKLRTDIVTLGPYIPTEIISGVGFKAKANPYYFKGKPKVENLSVEVISGRNYLEITKKGYYDIMVFALGSTEDYPILEKFNNIEIIGNMSSGYSAFEIKLGYWDKDRNENILDPNNKLADKRVRQALAYALDIDNKITDVKIKGAGHYNLTERATTVIPPILKKYYNENIQGYPYNPEKAKRLLDEAGYRDINGDGIREDKNGQPFVITIAKGEDNYIDTGKKVDAYKSVVGHAVEYWKKVGINARIVTGDFQELQKKNRGDDKEIDIYYVANGLTYDAYNPYFYKRRKNFNTTSRFASEENDRLLDETVSQRSMKDEMYKIQAYKKWQEYYMEQLPEIPLFYSYNIVIVNKRVKNFYIFDNGTLNTLYMTELTAQAPYSSSR